MHNAEVQRFDISNEVTFVNEAQDTPSVVLDGILENRLWSSVDSVCHLFEMYRNFVDTAGIHRIHIAHKNEYAFFFSLLILRNIYEKLE